MIDAREHQDVATADVACTFLHTQSDEDVIMVLEGALAELMVKVDHTLYRILRSALLFYHNLVGDLEAEGFAINPYDPCVANKLINGKQITIIWHVDDLKISHVDRFEVTNMLYVLGRLYPGLTVKK